MTWLDAVQQRDAGKRLCEKEDADCEVCVAEQDRHHLVLLVEPVVQALRRLPHPWPACPHDENCGGCRALTLVDAAQPPEETP